MNDLIQKLKTVNNQQNAKYPEWLAAFKTKCLERAEQQGIPTTKHEEWKYTSLANLNNLTLDGTKAETQNIPEALKEYTQPDEINLVFINGIFNKELSSTETIPGVTVQLLTKVLNKNESEIKNVLTTTKIGNNNTFVDLNDALFNEGVFIKAEKGTVSEKLIHAIYLTTTDKTIANNTRTIIQLEDSCELNVLSSFLAFDKDLKYFTNTLTDCIVGDNSTLHYIKAQSESEASYHISNTRVSIGRDANFKGFTQTTHSGFTRNDLDIVINGEGSDATLHSLYSTFNKQHVDNHTSVDHRVPNCTSNQLYKGILNDESHAVFNGKIFVRDIAQQTNSYQLNKNILIGKKSRVDTKPQLEIFADDVKCTHGATIGQLEEDELFYLQTRGVTRKEAIRIIASGFAEESLEAIKLQSVRDKLFTLLKPSIDHL